MCRIQPFIIIFVFLVVILLPISIYSAEPMLKWGLGTRSCAKFTEDFKQNPELWETLYYSWAEGFMSGFNLVRSNISNKDIDLNPYDRSEIWRRETIREYCSTHPLSPYSEAVVNLINELGKP